LLLKAYIAIKSVQMTELRSEKALATIKNQLWGYIEKGNKRFWRICLKVARSKPHLCAEAVEAEARRIMLGLRPEPRSFRI